jgi:hypothetical protein
MFMRAVARAASVLLAAAFLAASVAQATSFSTDQSDLWYIVSESGWGMQLVQRGNTIFATLFVYGQNGAPTWYVATMVPTGTASQWSGDLYATTGPWFGTVPFNPANVVATKVGTMTWTQQTVATGTLNYVVSGTAVTKNVVRQTLVFDDFSGTYLGAIHIGATGCTDPSNNVPPTNLPATTITVTQNGQTATIALSIAGVTLITITGQLTQDGQFGTVVGPYTTAVVEVGNATVSAMNVQSTSFAANIETDSTNIGCKTVGYIAGMRSQ